MPRKKIDFEAVRKIALSLPNVEEYTHYGSPAFHARGKLLACIPTHKSAEPDSLIVSVDFEQRAELLSAAPEIYYVKDHYLNYPVVLVRMSRLRSEDLRDVLGMGWRFATAKARAGPRPLPD